MTRPSTALRWPLATALVAASLGAVSAAPVAPDAPVAPRRAAESLPDPMRPPATAPALAAGGTRSERPRAESRPARLQSVLLGEAGARAAVIDGTLLAVGDRLGDARLTRLTERSAVLVGPQGQTTTLLLIPGVDKQDVATPSRSSPAAPPGPATSPSPRTARSLARRATETSP